MPDMKCSDEPTARRLFGVRDYPAMNRAAVREMHRQVGDLTTSDEGVAQRGLLVRHLVLPGGLSGTGEIVRFIAQDISEDTYLNIMDQYMPALEGPDLPPLDRRIEPSEYHAALRSAHEAGLDRLDPRSRF